MNNVNASKWRAVLAVTAAVGCGVFLALASEALNWSGTSVAAVGLALAALLGLLGAPLVLLPLETRPSEDGPDGAWLTNAPPTADQLESGAMLIPLLAAWDKELVLDGRSADLLTLAQSAIEFSDSGGDVAYARDLVERLRGEILALESKKYFEEENQSSYSFDAYAKEVDFLTLRPAQKRLDNFNDPLPLEPA